MMEYKFPNDFIFGVATAAQQIEGAAFEDGRGLSIWDVFSRIPGKIKNNGIPDICCDSYHNIERDVNMLKELGVDAYRMSFSWSRIIPDGIGEVNQAGINYYKKLFQALKEAGIKINASIYHWDLPYALSIKGGFGNRKIIDWYKNYVDVLFDNFGADVDFWATFNEPIATYVGYAKGFFAPGLTDEKYARQCIHNLLVCHGEAVKLFRKRNFVNSKIGIVVDVWKHLPSNPNSQEDIESAIYNNEIEGYGMFLHPLFLGGYSEIYNKYLNDNNMMPQVEPGDFDVIKQDLDYYGLNFYNGLYDDVEKTKNASKDEAAGGNYQDRPELHLEVLSDVFKMLVDDYKINIPIYMTENGMPQDDGAGIENNLIDDDRIEYTEEVLRLIHEAISQGINVKGYYHWSLMDNFEWSAGFAARYGLFYSDYENMKFIPKKSAKWYRDYIISSKNNN